MARRAPHRLLWVLVGTAVLAVGLNIAMTVGPRLTTGDAARAAMTDDERAYFDERFGLIRPGMTESEVRGVLGPPCQEMCLSEMSWHGPDQAAGRESRVIVRFRDDRVTAATWYCRTGVFSGFFCQVGG